MKLYKVNDMKRGWFIGDFEPNVIRTKGFEVGYLHHRAGEKWPSHYHKIATEINLLISRQYDNLWKVNKCGRNICN